AHGRRARRPHHDLRFARAWLRAGDRPVSARASAPARRLRIGVAGLGRAFTLMLPAFRAHPRVEVVAAADPRSEARSAFERDFGAPAYDSPARLLADRNVEAVYIATPHEHHAEQAIAAARAGKHVL